MMRICGIAIVLVLNVWAGQLAAQTPPRPWEKYNAVLNSDYVLLVQLVDTAVVDLKGPYFTWKEKRVIAKLRVDSVLYVSSNQTDRRPKYINVLLPSLVEYDEAPHDYGPQTISFPKFFAQQQQFIAALIHTNDHDRFVASSVYPWYSFVVKDSLMTSLVKRAKRNSIDRSKAMSIARNTFKPHDGTVAVRVVGVQIVKDAVRELKYEDSNAQLMWRASSDNNSKIIYIHPVSGKVFTSTP